MTKDRQTLHPDALERARADLRKASMLADRAAATLSAELGTPLEPGVEGPMKEVEDPTARHRRLHRRGVLSKIEADPTLRAFILDRIDTMTFAEIVAAAATAFTPDRRPSNSGLHRWWHRHGKAAAQALRQAGATTNPSGQVHAQVATSGFKP